MSASKIKEILLEDLKNQETLQKSVNPQFSISAIVLTHYIKKLLKELEG